MVKDTNDIQREIELLEAEMQAPYFWDDKNKDLTPLLAGPNERNQ